MGIAGKHGDSTLFGTNKATTSKINGMPVPRKTLNFVVPAELHHRLVA
jgi:hypothetical protein